MAKTGRRTKLTSEVTETICEGIRLRMTHKHAAMRADIGERTFYRWLSEGEAAETKFRGTKERLTKKEKAVRQFWQAVTRAIADGQAALLAYVHKAAQEDWRAAAFILERRHPEEFARPGKQEVTVSGEIGTRVSLDDTAKSAAEKLASILAERASDGGDDEDPGDTEPDGDSGS